MVNIAYLSRRISTTAIAAVALYGIQADALAADRSGVVFSGLSPGGIPVEFILFALLLSLVALFPSRSGTTAAVGALAVIAYKLAFSPFDEGPGWNGLLAHIGHEWVELGNLLALMLGFTLLTKHFERSQAPAAMRRYLS